MPSSHSDTYRITAAMLDAGALAMEQCHLVGGHTARTVSHAVFIAMLNAADTHPGSSLRRSFAFSRHEDGPTQSRPPLARPLETYAGFRLARHYLWQGFDVKHRLHYFKRDGVEEWIRLTEPAWCSSKFDFEMRRNGYHVDSAIAYMNMRKKTFTKP